jgi:hypothetical protein
MTTIFKEDIFGANQGQNARPFIDKLASFCPTCHIAQTYIQGKKKLKKEFEKEYVQIVLNCINKNNMKIFTKKDLMIALNILHLSNGVMQDNALSILIMLGHIRRENQEFYNEKKELKIRSVYIKQLTPKPPVCYDSERDKHIKFDWFNEGNRIRFKERGDGNGTRV